MMKNKNDATCLNCEWNGSKYELILKIDSEKYFCPKCESSNIGILKSIPSEQLLEELKKHFLKKLI